MEKNNVLDDLYMKKLVSLYVFSQGINDGNINTLDFLQWLNSYVKLTGYYAEFEQEYGFDLSSRFVCEVGKGELDSIAAGACVVSPFASTFGKTNGNLVITTKGPLVNTCGMFVSADNVSSFITQNPYDPSLVKKWELLFNRYGYGVGIGVYGDIHDKDMRDKISLLKEFSNVLFDSKIEYATMDDNYFALVKSNPKSLSLLKK